MAEFLSKGKWKRTRHLQLLSDLYADSIFKANGVENVMVQVPVRHGKSELTSHWAPIWFLELFPDKKVGLASYEAQIAAKWGRRVRNTIAENADTLRVRLSPDSKAKARWDTTEGGGMMTAGVGGPFTGEGFHVLVLDDLYKNWQQSNSQVYRDTVWNWFLSTALTRLEPGGVVWIPMTRWHEDDIIGRLKRQASEQDADLEDALDGRSLEFIEVKLPAIAGPDDQLGRAEGEALWPERYPVTRLRMLEKTVGSRVWSSVFQQEPQQAVGTMFSRENFRYWSRQTNGADLYILHRGNDEEDRRWDPGRGVKWATIDLASGKSKKGDWIVFGAWQLCPPDDLLLIDRMRIKVGAPEQLDAARQFYHRNGLAFLSVESVAYQSAFVQLLRKGGSDGPPIPTREFFPGKYGDKILRAQAAQVYQEQGNLYYPRGVPWLDEWEAEMVAFPDGDYDDQVDVQSMAVIQVVSGQIAGSAGKLSIALDSDTRESPWRI